MPVASKGNMPSNTGTPDYNAVVIVQPRLDGIVKKPAATPFISLRRMSLQTAIKADPLYSNSASTAVHNG